MTDRLLVDLGADGRVPMSTWLDGELPSPAGEPAEVVWPLDADTLEDLRWYLEDYLRRLSESMASGGRGCGPSDRLGASGVQGGIRYWPSP